MIDQDATSSDMPYKGITWVDNKTILTLTSGFLASGYTHTLNPYQGCAFAGAACGIFCYAQHQYTITRGRPWGLYGAKLHIRDAYQHDYDHLKRPQRGEPKPLKIFMASSTDPYVPHEQRLGLTRAILEEMQTRPPDVLVLQTHTILIQRDLDLIQELARRCELWVSITVETDMERVPGFPAHASSPAKRLETLKLFRDAGVPTQATISPLMPLADPQTFAWKLDKACDRVILDHYLLGDGTHGARTRRTNFIPLLEQAGYGEWARLEKFWEVRDMLAGVLGEHRVLVSAEGFNAVGINRQPTSDPSDNFQSTTGEDLMAVQVNDASPDLRKRARGAAQWFNGSETWVPLARVLTEIKAGKVFRAWGFRSFSRYVQDELDLTKSGASELVLAYNYTGFHHPERLEKSSAAEHFPIPTYTTVAMLARQVTRLSDDVMEVLDTALFAGTLKRPGLKEAIRKALPQQQTSTDPTVMDSSEGNAELQQESRRPTDALQSFLGFLDVEVLRDQVTLVFDGWAEAAISERRQLFVRLIALLDQLEAIQQAIP